MQPASSQQGIPTTLDPPPMIERAGSGTVRAASFPATFHLPVVGLGKKTNGEALPPSLANFVLDEDDS